LPDVCFQTIIESLGVTRRSRIKACVVCGRRAGENAANCNIMSGDDVKEIFGSNLRFDSPAATTATSRVNLTQVFRNFRRRPLLSIQYHNEFMLSCGQRVSQATGMHPLAKSPPVCSHCNSMLLQAFSANCNPSFFPAPESGSQSQRVFLDSYTYLADLFGLVLKIWRL
jgi:hypothetical protein